MKLNLGLIRAVRRNHGDNFFLSQRYWLPPFEESMLISSLFNYYDENKVYYLHKFSVYSTTPLEMMVIDKDLHPRFWLVSFGTDFEFNIFPPEKIKASIAIKQNYTATDLELFFNYISIPKSYEEQFEEDIMNVIELGSVEAWRIIRKYNGQATIVSYEDTLNPYGEASYNLISEERTHFRFYITRINLYATDDVYGEIQDAYDNYRYRIPLFPTVKKGIDLLPLYGFDWREDTKVVLKFLVRNLTAGSVDIGFSFEGFTIPFDYVEDFEKEFFGEE